mmetsp:Transcript_26296/g.43205  ORF Transcript_26296/g.43205 Transcript_26296/m.43205 type:complete len:185 (-) Transcript_26296:186-740(-)
MKWPRCLPRVRKRLNDKCYGTMPSTVLCSGLQSRRVWPWSLSLLSLPFCKNALGPVQAGTISLLLTLSNVVLIVISSMIMFRLKELPVKKKIAWQDLGVARKIFSDRAIMMTPTKEGASTDLDLSIDNSSLFMFRNNSVTTPPMMMLPRMDEIKEYEEEECFVTIAGDNSNNEETAVDLEEGRQ